LFKGLGLFAGIGIKRVINISYWLAADTGEKAGSLQVITKGIRRYFFNNIRIRIGDKKNVLGIRHPSQDPHRV
jgi:hypothetical protein